MTGAVAVERVVVLSDRSAAIGGAEAMALLNVDEMVKAGVAVTLITGDSAEDCPVDRSKVEVIALGASPPDETRLLESSGRALFNESARRLVAQFISERDTPGTVYHLHNWSKIFSPSIFLSLRSVSSRLFMSAHDFALVCPTLSYSNYQRDGAPCHLTPLSTKCVLTHCDRQSYLHKLWRVTRSLALRRFLDIANSGALVGVIHPDMAEFFTRGGIPQKSLRVVRNPVRPYSAERIAAERNSDIFLIGRVVHEKGVDLAAEAARQVGRRLRVIGDGDARPALQARYPEVVFEGWRTHDQISALIRDARAVVVPSRLPETFTLVAHEAMRSGVPVVAFSDVDCSEAAALGGAIVVPPREIADLAAGLRRLDDDTQTAAISRIAFAEAPRFSNTAETWRSAMLEHYGELLAQPPGAGDGFGDQRSEARVERRIAVERTHRDQRVPELQS